MQYLSYGLPLALLVSGSFANPLERRDDWAACTSDACLAAVTGKAALGDDSLRKGHCASYLATTVTPPAVTVTATVTGESWDQNWKRASVTVCPNEVPNYASACDEAAYTSACSCYGFTDVVTTTLAPTTTTKTVYVAPTSCASGGATTVTVTAGGSGGSWASTVTVTVTSATATVTSAGTCTSGSWPTGSPTPASCIVTDALASGIVFNFTQLLERTSFPGSANPYIPAGSGYPQDISNATLADDFSDISDSINFMAGFPLGSVTFPTKEFFDYGQGVLQPEVSVTTLNVWHDCSSITWRWRLTSGPGSFPVNGINYMIIDSDGKIQKNYAEFDNGAWLESFGQQCATKNVTVAATAALKKRTFKLSSIKN